LKRLAVLISGQGRNLQAILDASAAEKLPLQVACVISNRGAAGGLDRAREAGVATEVVSHAEYLDRERFDRALAVALDRHKPDIVALAGFMRVLGDGFIRKFRGRMVNIHPSLLP
jgi:phosphoribosylglycinamide formyltransferase-1